MLTSRRCTCRGPGHADLVGTQKYGLTDVRDVLERASARETAARVAGGAVARAFLTRARRPGVLARDPDHLGQGSAADTTFPRPTSSTSTSRRFAASIARRARRWSKRSTVSERPTSRSAGCSRCGRSGSFPGSGSHVSWEQRLDGRLGQAILSIQAIKGVAIGDGLRDRRASLVPRPTTRSSGTSIAATTARPTARAVSRAA